jgi:hypothetical protein
MAAAFRLWRRIFAARDGENIGKRLLLQSLARR